MHLREDEVYLGTKSLLAKHGWLLIGGQPPSGCNHLPVIEVKDKRMNERGSRGAYKPDLVAYKNGILMLIECKPKRNLRDIRKLREILADDARKRALLNEIDQRKALERVGVEQATSGLRIAGAVAHSGKGAAMDDLWTIIIADVSGHGTITEPKGGA